MAWTLSSAVTIFSGYASNANPLSPTAYLRFDSEQYLSIARKGYEIYSCTDSNYKWCGNPGWFPGYPLLIRVFAHFPIGFNSAGILVSNICLLLALILLRLIFEDLKHGEKNAYYLASVFFGAIYYHAIFPISLLVCFVIATILFLNRQRYLLASMAAVGGAFSYPTGVLLGGVVFLGVLVTSNTKDLRSALRAVLYSAIATTGFVAVLVLHQMLLGKWDAFFLIQAKFGHGLHNPIASYLAIWQNCYDCVRPESFFPKAQTLLISLVILGSTAALFLQRKPVAAIEWIVFSQAWIFWLVPVLLISDQHMNVYAREGGASLVRAGANLLPIVLLAARLPRAALPLAFVALLIMDLWVSNAFFDSLLH